MLSGKFLKGHYCNNPDDIIRVIVSDMQMLKEAILLFTQADSKLVYQYNTTCK